MSRPRIFLDMDGVLADFDGRFRMITGYTADSFCEHFGTNQMWRVIHAEARFFATLRLLPDARALYDAVAHLEPIILTGAPTKHPDVAAQKREWAARHFPGVSVITCESADKYLHCRPGDVLIDDWDKYPRPWRDAGGTFILHTRTHKSLAELWDLHPALQTLCERCSGGGWAEVRSQRPPAFQECPDCLNPYEEECP